MSSTTTASDAAAVLALIQAQAAVRENLTAQASAVAVAAAAGFDGWYDTALITEWAATLAGRVQPIQRVLAQSTDAYLARLLSLLTGSRVRPVGRIDVATLRPGMTHAGAYGKAADAYRWQQSQLDAATRTITTDTNPQPPVLQTPVEAAADRIRSVAEMDAQLAVRAQSQATLTPAHQKGVVTGYRRVIHPELSRGGTCGLCVAASHRVYHVENLMPIHHRCNCLPMPIIDGNDPGAVVNDADLARLYQEAGSTGAADLKSTRYRVTDAGALGPVLEPDTARRRQTRAAAARDSARPVKTEAQRLEQLTRIRDDYAASIDKVTPLAAADPKKWGDALRNMQVRLDDLNRQIGG